MMRRDDTHACQSLTAKDSRFWHLNLTLLPTLVMAALPKCPLCLMGLMSVVGLGSFIQASWLLPLTLTFLIIALGAMALRANKRHNYGPFGLGVISAVVILLGKFGVDYAPLTYAGLAMLVCASLWNSWPGRKTYKADCEC